MEKCKWNAKIERVSTLENPILGIFRSSYGWSNIILDFQKIVNWIFHPNIILSVTIQYLLTFNLDNYLLWSTKEEVPNHYSGEHESDHTSRHPRKINFINFFEVNSFYFIFIRKCSVTYKRRWNTRVRYFDIDNDLILVLSYIATLFSSYNLSTSFCTLLYWLTLFPGRNIHPYVKKLSRSTFIGC